MGGGPKLAVVCLIREIECASIWLNRTIQAMLHGVPLRRWHLEKVKQSYRSVRGAPRRGLGSMAHFKKGQNSSLLRTPGHLTLPILPHDCSSLERARARSALCGTGHVLCKKEIVGVGVSSPLAIYRSLHWIFIQGLWG